MHAITHETIEKYPNGYPPFPPEYSRYFKKSPVAWTVMYNPPVAEKMTFHLDEHFSRVPPSCYCLNDPDSVVKYIREHQRNYRFVMEGLIATYPTKKVLSRYKSTFKEVVRKELADAEFPASFEFGSGKLQDWVLVEDESEEVSPSVGVFVPAADELDADRILKAFADDFQATGYYLTSYQVFRDALPGFLIVFIQFEAKYTNKLAELADVLYHVTPLKHLPKVLKNGLVPKAKSSEFKYDSRIYLFNKCPKDVVYSYGTAKAVSEHDIGFCVFKTRKEDLLNDLLFKDGKQKLYLDPAFCDEEHPQTAVFTYGNVPLRALSKQYVVVKLDEKGKIASEETREL